MACDCEGYQKNVKHLDAVFMSAHVHNVKYKGETFKFCSWCGKEMKLKEK